MHFMKDFGTEDKPILIKEQFVLVNIRFNFSGLKDLSRFILQIVLFVQSSSRKSVKFYCMSFCL